MELEKKEIYSIFIICLTGTLLGIYLVYYTGSYEHIPIALIPLAVFAGALSGWRLRKRLGLDALLKRTVWGLIAEVLVAETLWLATFVGAYYLLKNIQAPIGTFVVAFLIYSAMAILLYRWFHKSLKEVAEREREGPKDNGKGS